MAFTKSEAGKGDDNRTANWNAYWENYDKIFKKSKETEPQTKEPENKLQKTDNKL